MTCPFLKEAQVKFCQTASIRKLIPLTGAASADEKCASSAHGECSVYRQHPAEQSPAGPCPYLRESLMQYCGAAPVAKMIPYSESLLGRCGNDSFRYCELYLNMLHPGRERSDAEAIPMPDGLRYSANHMWLDIAEDGVCHAGVDAFLMRVLGRVDRVSYVWQRGVRHPAAALTAAGIDLEVAFPNPLMLTACNLYLRADPARLAADPYSAGWLFEGRLVPESTANLIEGEAAHRWMDREQHRMNEFLQEGTCLAADGGLFVPGVAGLIEREQFLALFHEFFSPMAKL
jgi:glycine cleavage system H lipoate-binding protein